MRISLVRTDGAQIELDTRTRSTEETQAFLLQFADAYEEWVKTDIKLGLTLPALAAFNAVDVTLDPEDEAEDAAGS